MKYKTAEEVLSLILPVVETKRQAELERAFFQQKHLVTIQTVLAAYLGTATTYHHGMCHITSVDYTPEGTEIRAMVRPGVPRTAFSSCGGCSSALDSNS